MDLFNIIMDIWAIICLSLSLIISYKRHKELGKFEYLVIAWLCFFSIWVIFNIFFIK